MKALFSFIFLIAFLPFMICQDLAFGAKLGINFAGWSSNADDVGTRLGWHLGGTATYPLQEALSARGELLFSMQGVRSTDDDIEGRSSQLYLSIPLLADYAITEAASVHAGFQPSFLLSAKQKITEPNKRTVDVGDEFTSLDFAFVFGGEYQVQEMINVGLRVVLGLSDIITYDEGEAKHRVVQLFGRYRLPY